MFSSTTCIFHLLTTRTFCEQLAILRHSNETKGKTKFSHSKIVSLFSTPSVVDGDWSRESVDYFWIEEKLREQRVWWIVECWYELSVLLIQQNRLSFRKNLLFVWKFVNCSQKKVECRKKRILLLIFQREFALSDSSSMLCGGERKMSDEKKGVNA